MIGLRALRLAGAALIAVSATLAFSASAASADTPVTPDSGDARAVVVHGNVTTCEGAGLTGTLLNGVDLVRDGNAIPNDSQTMVTISSLPDGLTSLSAIVVKGGNNYNLYEPGKRGLGMSLPYADLHSPLVGQNRNIPVISHWFACAGQASTTGGGTTGGGTTGGGTTGGGTTGGGTTGGTAGGNDQQVESATAPESQANADKLANTGFDPTMPTILAVLLLLVGGLMVITPRRAMALVGRLRRR